MLDDTTAVASDAASIKTKLHEHMQLDVHVSPPSTTAAVTRASISRDTASSSPDLTDAALVQTGSAPSAGLIQPLAARDPPRGLGGEIEGGEPPSMTGSAPLLQEILVPTGVLTATYYLLLTTYYLLRTAYYLLLTTDYLLLTTYYLLLATYCLLLTAYYVLLTTYPLLQEILVPTGETRSPLPAPTPRAHAQAPPSSPNATRKNARASTCTYART